MLRKLQELPEEAREAVVDEKDAQGYTALHHAAENGHVKVMEILILNGAGKTSRLACPCVSNFLHSFDGNFIVLYNDLHRC